MNDKSIKQMAGYTLLYDWEWANEFSHISDNKIAWLRRGWVDGETQLFRNEM